MEVYQELGHACKFCGKSFPCGRSLGGHMRSHLNNTDESTNKIRKKKLQSFSNDDKEAAAQNGYYSLREKPKRTNKFTISSEEFSLDDDHDDSNKICRECGKKFTTWKALFGHMKCHSDKVSVSVEDDDSLNISDQKLVLDNQSNNEAAAPIRKQRRSRTTKRYKNIAVTNNDFRVNNDSPCISEIEQEQEEVALSLILLSRDVTVHCGGWKSAKADYSSEINSSARISPVTVSDSKSEIKNLGSGGSEFIKSKTVKTARLDLTSLDSDSLKSLLKQPEDTSCSISRNGIGEMIQEVAGNGTKQGNEIQPQGIEVGLPEVKNSELEIKKPKSNKRRSNKMHDPEKFVESSMNLCYGKSDSSFHFADSDRNSKFECTSCNKVFQSYQALGGHRAGHKKMKGCLGSKIASSENSTETEVSPNQTADSKTIINEKIPTEISAENIRISEHGTKKIREKVHACPICFKTFPSGQALGGHKRSHLIAEAKSNKQQSEATATSESSKVVDNKIKIPEIRDFLDLNMPAPEDELAESNERKYYNPWWIGSNQKQDQLVGLML